MSIESARKNEELIRNAMKLRKEKAKRLKARHALIDFSLKVFPGYEVSEHHAYIAEILRKALDREDGYTKIVLHEPPQHGKSLQVSTLFPAWYLGNRPDDPVILTAYSDAHAVGFSRKIRNIVDSPEYSQIFPGMEMSKDSRAANRWDLINHKGELIGSGINGRITGKGAKLLLIDDPIKNRAEAESDIYRESLKEAYRSTLLTRLHKDAVTILVMTRWHEDDLAGWLIKEHGFKYICLPCIAEQDDPLGRPFGEALWPDRFPVDMMEERKIDIGLYNWHSMYQGNPRPKEGLLFKRTYFNIIDTVPSDITWVRFWDLAVTEEDSGDFTASIRIGHNDLGNIYLDGRIKKRCEWPTARRLILETAKVEKDTVMIGIGNQGPQKGMVQDIMTDPALSGHGIIGVPELQSKRVRAYPLIAKGEAGKLYLVRAPWNEDFINECLEFDVGKHDDQVDAATGAMRLLAFAAPGTGDDLNTLLERDIEDDTIPETYLDGITDEYENDFNEYVTPMFSA